MLVYSKVIADVLDGLASLINMESDRTGQVQHLVSSHQN